MTIDAAFHKKISWNDLEWSSIYRDVRRIQARIVKAVQEGKWYKVRALQRLLTRSFSGKALSVKRVTENQGKKTSGVDGKVWDTPTKKMAALAQLKQNCYKTLPLKRVYIPKKNGKQRPLGIPSMRDRAMQALYLLALDPVAETQADPNSYGFRIGRSTADAIRRCFDVLHRGHGAQWVLEADIQSCFDQINHEWLMANIPMDKTILRKWLKAGFIDKNTFYLTKSGTPQGGIISPTLCNMTLDGMERELRRAFGRPTSRLASKSKVNFVRYADDCVPRRLCKEVA